MKLPVLFILGTFLLAAASEIPNSPSPSTNTEAQTGTEFIPPPTQESTPEPSQAAEDVVDLNELAEKIPAAHEDDEIPDDKDIFDLVIEEEPEGKENKEEGVLPFLPHNLPPLHSMHMPLPRPDFELHLPGPSFPRGPSPFRHPAMDFEELVGEDEDELRPFPRMRRHTPNLLGGLLGALHPMPMHDPVRVLPLGSASFGPSPFNPASFGPAFHFNPQPVPQIFDVRSMLDTMQPLAHSSMYPMLGNPHPMLLPTFASGPIRRPPSPLSPSILSDVLEGVLNDLPEDVHHFVQAKHDAIPSEHEAMVLKMEKKNNFYVVTGFFPGVNKTDLKLKLDGSNLVVTANVTADDDKTKAELGEFEDIDEVDETMELPYAPDSRYFKAHFDEEKHTLTAVFPQEKETDIPLV